VVLEVRVLGTVDFAHAACAELFCDAVVGKGCADHGVPLSFRELHLVQQRLEARVGAEGIGNRAYL